MTTQQHGERIPEWTLADRLRKARSTTGLNTRDFAERLGVSQKTVNNAESGAHGVRKIVLNAWALATGVPVEWLETGNAPDQPQGPDGGGKYAIRDSNPEPAGSVHSLADLLVLRGDRLGIAA